MLLLPRRFAGGGRRPFSLTQFVKAGWAGRKCCSKAFSLAQSGKNAFAPRIRNPEVTLLAPAERIILWRPSLRVIFSPRVGRYNALDERIVVMTFWWKMERNTNTFWKFFRSFCRAFNDDIPEIRRNMLIVWEQVEANNCNQYTYILSIFRNYNPNEIF